MDSLQTALLEIAKLSATVSFLWWYLKKVGAKQEAMEDSQAKQNCDVEKSLASQNTRISLVEQTAKSVSADHDKLILVEAAVNAAHNRLDDFKGGH